MPASPSAHAPQTPANDPLGQWFAAIDAAAHASLAKATGGLAPASFVQSYSDWLVHLCASPGTCADLAAMAAANALHLLGAADTPALKAGPTLKAEERDDHRFTDPAWDSWPFSLLVQGFLMNECWWQAATTSPKGVSRHHAAITAFTARQILDTLAPSNFITTNPALQARIAETGGQCLLAGAALWLEDASRAARHAPPCGAEAFRPGENIAATPGKVIYRNRLIELIQYTPTTGQVRPEPVLIVPAWIMKYYILDLSATNSLIGWLVGQGYSVFAISWHNPTSADRDLGMEDYRKLGVMAALDAISAITGPPKIDTPKIHILGYCLGGTLVAIAAAAMARDGDQRLASITLLAAQTDFTEPGELGLFIDEAQLNLLDALMWRQGYLDSTQMGGAFQMLRSNDLIWSHRLKTYLMGEREPMNDLMAWNGDGTRMPYAMHSQYLHQLFLDNALAEGRFMVEDRPISLAAITAPLFVVGTERDHVAPWHSVFKIHRLCAAEITFALTSGGHNAGIVCEPGHAHRHYRLSTRPAHAGAPTPAAWQADAEQHDGSWWQAWGDWLGAHSSGPQAPPPMGAAPQGYGVLCDAPGTYIMER